MNAAPSVDLTDSLYRETLLYMRIQLKSDSLMQTSIKTIHAILSNIVLHPTEEKFRKLRLANNKIKTNITDIKEARFLLEMLCFEEKNLPLPSSVDTVEPYLVLNIHRCDFRDIKHLIQIL